ncbi:MAG: hypothetical protein J7M08_10395 [Planctomycetes bacterium]|nr:hypothetical protein [Planctomycetota bacterium]
MVSNVDLCGRIQRIYMDGLAQVPYPSFMNILNELLIDPVKIEPKPPTEELYQYFRAACMAVNVGVFDVEGRGGERVREFQEKVYPFWKDNLPPEDFRQFEDIMRGALRNKNRASSKQAESEAALQIDPNAVSQKTATLLERLGLSKDERSEAGRPPPAPAQARQAPPEDVPLEMEVEEVESSDAAASTVFDSIDDFVTAARQGQVKLKRTTREQNEPSARYRLHEQEVQVKVFQEENQLYVVLTVGIGRQQAPGDAEWLDLLAAQMGYVRMADFAYMRKVGDTFRTLKVTPASASLACALTRIREPETLLLSVQRLHRDLGELVEKLS